MGKGPSGAGDAPARGAGVMSISSALDAAKAEFVRNVKDSEEVMETLEVTSLAEIREVSAEIVAQNRENARRALEKASATVGGGAWVSPKSGDALVAPLAGSRRAADKAKRRSSNTERERKSHESLSPEKPPPESSPLARALDSQLGVALRRAVAREPPDFDVVEERGKTAGPGPGPEPVAGAKKVIRRKPARRPPPEPVAGESLSASLQKHAAVAPLVERARALKLEAEEKAERARRAAEDAKNKAEAKAEQARLEAEHVAAEARRVAAERAREAEEARKAAEEEARAKAAADASSAPPPPPTLAEREVAARKTAAAAAKKAKAAESRVARERFDLERRSRVRERARAQRARDVAQAERDAAKARDAETRALEEEKIQRELERAVKHQEVERAKRKFREDRAKAEAAFSAEEERRRRYAEKAIGKLVRTTESGVGGRKGPNADDVGVVERKAREEARAAKRARDEARASLEKQELDALRLLTASMRLYDSECARETKEREAKRRALVVRHAEAATREKQRRLDVETAVVAEREKDARDFEKRGAELEKDLRDALAEAKRVAELCAVETELLGVERRRRAEEAALKAERTRRDEEARRDSARRDALAAFEEKKALAAKARVAKEEAARADRARRDAETQRKRDAELRAAAAKEEARKKEEAAFREAKAKAASAERDARRKEEEEQRRREIRAMTPQQRAREKRASRAAALAERDAKLKTGEAKTALVKSAGVVLGHAGAALMIGAAFGAGSYLAMKGAGLTHRALTERSHRRREKRGDATPKPPTHGRGSKLQNQNRDVNFRVPGSASSAGTAFNTNRSRDGSSANSSLGNTPSQSPRLPGSAGERFGSPNEEDLDDVDLVSPLNTQRSDEERSVSQKNQMRPRETKKPPGVPRLPLNRLWGGPSPPDSTETTERRDAPETRDEKVVSDAGTASSTPRTLEVSDMSHIEGPNDPEKEIEDSRSLPNTARRAAEALASERSLKSSLNEARDKLARYERVVKSERRAKMAAVEHAAKLAAAAEALADLERGDDGDDVEQNDSLSSPRIAARAADLAFDALMSPSSRDGDDAAALASMREKERAQYEKAEAALARARGARRARDKLLLEERAKWTRVLEVAKAESGKAHEEAERREASLREMFAKQKARVDALNVELESASAASARADAAARDAAAKAKRAEAQAEKAAREARDLKAGDDKPNKSSGTAGSGSVSPRAARAAETEAAARNAAAEAAAAAKEAAFHRAASEKSVGDLDRVTRAAEAEISQAKREADALRAELDRAARAAKEREKTHAAHLKRREAEFEKREQKAKAEANKTVARVSTSASADLKAALDREKKLEDLLRRAEAKEKRLVQEQKALVEAQRDARADGAGGSREGSAGTEVASAAGSWPSDERDENSRNLVSENAAHAAELDRLRLEAARERAAALEELRAVHAADLEKRGGALRATREQLQEASREVASLREQFDVSSKTARAAELAAAEASAEAQSRARAAEATRAALQDAVSLAVASGASEEEVIAAMRKRGVTVERTERGLTVTF